MTKAQMSSTRYRLRRNMVRVVGSSRRLEGPDPGREESMPEKATGATRYRSLF
jgi:hypothetical protein